VNFLKKVPLYRMDFIYDFFAGRVGNSPYSDIIETPRIELATSSKVPYHIDGEPAGMEDHFEVSLSPGALTVLHPASTRRLI
jgi:diacylglycerol kinase family enzyme